MNGHLTCCQLTGGNRKPSGRTSGQADRADCRTDAALMHDDRWHTIRFSICQLVFGEAQHKANAHCPRESWKRTRDERGQRAWSWATAKRKTIFTLTRMLVASFRSFRFGFFLFFLLQPLPQLSTDSHLAIHQVVRLASTGHFLGPKEISTQHDRSKGVLHFIFKVKTVKKPAT